MIPDQDQEPFEEGTVEGMKRARMAHDLDEAQLQMSGDELVVFRDLYDSASQALDEACCGSSDIKEPTGIGSLIDADDS